MCHLMSCDPRRACVTCQIKKANALLQRWSEGKVRTADVHEWLAARPLPCVTAALGYALEWGSRSITLFASTATARACNTPHALVINAEFALASHRILHARGITLLHTHAQLL